MTKAINKQRQLWDEDPIILCIVFISISITLIGDFIKCLLTLHQPAAGSQGTIFTPSGKDRNQPPSASTNATAGTVDQKKVVGTTSKDGPSKRSVSSPRSKPSVKQSSSKQKQQKNTDLSVTTSVGTHGLLPSPTDTPKRTRKPDRTIADDNTRQTNESSIHQSTQSLCVLLEPQEETQEYTMLCTKDISGSNTNKSISQGFGTLRRNASNKSWSYQ